MKVEVKLQGLGVKEKPPTPMQGQTVKKPDKPIIRYPEVELTSKQMEGLGGLSKDSKCKLVFGAEVISIAEPSEWQKREQELTADDTVVRFRLNSGGIQSAEEITNKAKEYPR